MNSIDFWPYAAALFDFESSLVYNEPGPELKIFPDGGDIVYRMLIDNWDGERHQVDGNTVIDVDFWTLQGWGPVNEFLNDIMPYTLDGRKYITIHRSYYDYELKYGSNDGARNAANWQINANRPWAGLQPVIFDIETMGLDPNEYAFLSCSFQKGDDEENIHSVDVQSSGSEEQALIDVRDYLEAAPITLGFNSLRFDINYINTRLARYNERPMMLGRHIDVSNVYDEMIGRKKRTSLSKAVEEMALADNDAHKTPIDWPKWKAAYSGDKRGMAYVLEHAKYDVILTKRLYNAIHE